MKKIILLITLTVLFTMVLKNSAISDIFPYDPDESIGFIYLTKSYSQLDQRIHIPRAVKIRLFNKDKTPSGYLLAPKCKYAQQKCWEITFIFKGIKHKININDFVAVAYDGYCLQYYKKDNIYLKILEKSSKEDIFIAITELKKIGYTYQNWLSFLLKKKTRFYPNTALYLRKEPHKKAEKIVLMKKYTYQINLTGKTKGLWAEVNVKKCAQNCGIPDVKIIKRYKGWTKILDDKGFPNIWFSSKG